MHESLAAVIAALIVAAPAAAADFEGVMDSKMTVQGEQHGMSGTGKTYLGKAGLRMEMQMAAAGGGGPMDMKMTTLVLRSKPGLAYLVNDARKTYSEIDSARHAGREPSEPEKYAVKRLGSEKVAGYDCAHAVVTGEKGEQFEVWTTREIGGAAEYWASQRQGSRDRVAMFKALEEAGVVGWPMKWLHRSGKEGQVVWEVTRVERKSVPASLFDLAGYTRTEGGAMGGASQMQLSPEHQRQMDDAAQRRDEALKNLPPEQRKRVEEMMKSMNRGK